MKIWLINHYAVPPKYYPLARTTNFAKNLMAMGHEVTIFASSAVHNSDVNLIKDGSPYREETVDGVRYVYIKNRSYTGNGRDRIYNMCEFAWKMPGVLKKFPKPDAIVVSAMTHTACAMGIRLARKYHCVGVAEITDLWPETLVAYDRFLPSHPVVKILRRLEKWIYEKADAVVFSMEGAYDYILEQKWENTVPRDKVFFINNGIVMEEYEYNRDHYQIDDPDLKVPDTFKVVYTGSIRRVNNLGLLLDAAKKVNDPRIRFLVWGDGDEREMLEQRVRDEGISNVVFKGRVDKKFIPYITSSADLNFAHCTPAPLFRFGISFNKLFDYMAAGKPVLSDFPCPYNPSIDGGAGIGVDVPEPQVIAEAVEQFATMEPAVYEGYCRNALETARRYDFKILTQKLLDVINGCAK